MQMFKQLVTGLALSLPLTALAYSPDHPATGTQALQEMVQRYATQQGKPVPVIAEYRYGMPLDIARVRFQSPVSKTCNTEPRLMIYEDSKGELNAMQYQAMSECRANQ